jgi:uncharacterized protein (TIGR03437 family)
VSTGAGTAEEAPSSTLVTRLAGISLEVRDQSGARSLARLLYVGGTQVNFLVPESAALGEATLSIITSGASTRAGTMQVEAVAPGLFMMTGYSLTPAAFQVRTEADGSTTTHPLFDCSGPQNCERLLFRWSPRGSLLTFYGTGFRDASAGNVKCRYSTEEFAVVSVSPHGDIPGVDVITVRVQESEYLDPSRFEYFTAELALSIDGVATNRALVFFLLQP